MAMTQGTTLPDWIHYNPVKVIFESGGISRLANLIPPYQRLALVTSQGFVRRGVVADLRASLGQRLGCLVDDVKPNPDVVDIDAQAQRLRPHAPDCVMALGGGSSVDTAKALARLLTQPEPTASLSEHFREGLPLGEQPALPIIAIPTTAGTGSEVTPFGTVWDFEREKKHSVTGADLFPRLAVLDTHLIASLPWEIIVSSGLDAVSHALESVWNKNATPVSLGMATRSLQLSLTALPALCGEPGNPESHGLMQEASLLAGLAISQTRTALSHSISYPLTTRFGLPHGIACSFTLPALLTFNAEVENRQLQDTVAALGFGKPTALARALTDLYAQLDVARIFSRHVPQPAQVLDLVDSMYTPERADNNSRAVTPEDIEKILREAMTGLI